MDEREDCIVLYRTLQYLCQLGMVYRVKETSKVDANRIAVVLVYYLHHSHQCLIRSPIRT